MNFWKKYKYFRTYKKLIKKNKDILLQKYNMKVDNINRCYTVLNFPPDEQDNVRQYGYYYIDNQVRTYLRDVQEFFSEIGLFEMIGVSELSQLDDFNVLIIIEFKTLNSKKITIIKRWIYSFIIISLIVLGLLLIF